jgi:3D (Asp-Asp-Asp) domain-containing protein
LHYHHHGEWRAGTARITNYSGGQASRNADGSPVRWDHIAADWRVYPPGTVLGFLLRGRVVHAVVHDNGPAVRGSRHFDFRFPFFRLATGLTSRHDTATGVRFWVVRWGDGTRPVVRVGHGRSLEERRFGREVLGHRPHHHHRIRHRRHPQGHFREAVRKRHARGHWHEAGHFHSRYGANPRWDRARHAEHFKRHNRSHVRLRRHRRHHHGRHHGVH